MCVRVCEIAQQLPALDYRDYRRARACVLEVTASFPVFLQSTVQKLGDLVEHHRLLFL